MSNLSKYELLKHRHLSLLKQLDRVGVSAKMGDNGEWDIDTLPAPPVADERQLTVTFFDGGWLLQTMKTALDKLHCVIPHGATHAVISTKPVSKAYDRMCFSVTQPEFKIQPSAQLYGRSMRTGTCQTCMGFGKIMVDGKSAPCPAVGCPYRLPGQEDDGSVSAPAKA